MLWQACNECGLDFSCFFVFFLHRSAHSSMSVFFSSTMGLGSETFSLADCVPTAKYLLGSQMQEINKIHWAALFLVSVVCQTTCDFLMMDLQNKMVSSSSVERRLAKQQENTTWALLTDAPFALPKLHYAWLTLNTFCMRSVSDVHISCLFSLFFLQNMYWFK